MVAILVLDGEAGYVLVHLRRTRSLQPAERAVSTAFSRTKRQGQLK